MATKPVIVSVHQNIHYQFLQGHEGALFKRGNMAGVVLFICMDMNIKGKPTVFADFMFVLALFFIDIIVVH